MASIPQYKTVKTETLIPYAANSRTHSESQVAQIAASIAEYGFINPIIISKGGTLIAGHGRLLAARKLGLDLVPVLEVSHLTDAQRRAYVIADNRLAEMAGWDDDLLRIELSDLRESGFNIELTGFTDSFLDDAFFPDDNTDDEPKSEPRKTDEGYVEFSVVMQQYSKQLIMDAVNKLKKDGVATSTEEALLHMARAEL